SLIGSVDFNTVASSADFAADSGTWAVSGGALQVAGSGGVTSFQATSAGSDAVNVFYLDAQTPSYYEILATVKAVQLTAGANSNAYVIFDHYGPFDFKFAGVNASLGRMVIGHRTRDAWVIDKAGPQASPNTLYNLQVTVNGTTVSLLV